MAITGTTAIILKLLVSRGMFGMHSMFVIWKATNKFDNQVYWACAALYPFMLADMIFIFLKKEYKHWFLRLICPSAVFYILATVPGLIVMELDRLSRIKQLYLQTSITTNITQNGTVVGSSVISRFTFNELFFFHGDVGLDMLEQLLLIVLIAARWIMPKGELTRNELSQLLFVYTSIATDSMELFAMFKVRQIATSYNTSNVILAAWCASLLQLCLSLQSSPRKSRGGDFNPDVEDDELEEKTPEAIEKQNEGLQREKFCLLATFILMDAPFLSIRFYVVLVLRIVDYNVVFYFGKNALLVLFTAYRFAVIYGWIPSFEDDDEENMLFYNDFMDFAEFGGEAEDFTMEPHTAPMPPDKGDAATLKHVNEGGTAQALTDDVSQMDTEATEATTQGNTSRRRRKKSRKGGDKSEAGDVTEGITEGATEGGTERTSRRGRRKKSRKGGGAEGADDDKTEMTEGTEKTQEPTSRRRRRKTKSGGEDEGDKSEKTEKTEKTEVTSGGKKKRSKSKGTTDDENADKSEGNTLGGGKKDKKKSKSKANLDDADKSEGVTLGKKDKKKSKSKANLDEADKKKSKSKANLDDGDEGVTIGKKDKKKSKSKANLDDADKSEGITLGGKKSKKNKSKVGLDTKKSKKSKVNLDDAGDLTEKKSKKRRDPDEPADEKSTRKKSKKKDQDNVDNVDNLLWTKVEGADDAAAT